MRFEIQGDGSMQLRKTDSREIESVLRNLDKLEAENKQRLAAVQVNWDECQQNRELISKEEAILATSMPGISYGDKVDSSGDIYHDELLRTLEKSKRLYEMGMNSVMLEHNRLMENQNAYRLLRFCIAALPDESKGYIQDYYMKNLTPVEGADQFALSRSQLNKNLKDALESLTAAYNQRVEEENQVPA